MQQLQSTPELLPGGKAQRSLKANGAIWFAICWLEFCDACDASGLSCQRLSFLSVIVRHLTIIWTTGIWASCQDKSNANTVLCLARQLDFLPGVCCCEYLRKAKFELAIDKLMRYIVIWGGKQRTDRSSRDNTKQARQLQWKANACQEIQKECFGSNLHRERWKTR